MTNWKIPAPRTDLVYSTLLLVSCLVACQEVRVTASGEPGAQSICANAPAQWVFCSDMEEGNKDVWDDYDGNLDETNLLIEDPGPFDIPGNHVMQLRLPAGQDLADLVKVLPETHDRLYARWYVLSEAGFNFDVSNLGGGLHAGTHDTLGLSDLRPAGDDWFTATLGSGGSGRSYQARLIYRGMYQDCVDPQTACWADEIPCMIDEGESFCVKPQHRETVLPPTLTADRWYCVEMLIDAGDPVADDSQADGVLNLWIDGLEIGPWTDLWWRTTDQLKISVLWLNFSSSATPAPAGVYLDNVVVSTERVGCQ